MNSAFQSSQSHHSIVNPTDNNKNSITHITSFWPLREQGDPSANNHTVVQLDYWTRIDIKSTPSLLKGRPYKSICCCCCCGLLTTNLINKLHVVLQPQIDTYLRSACARTGVVEVEWSLRNFLICTNGKRSFVSGDDICNR